MQAVMELLSDSVPNVRLAALGLLPALKQTIRLPEDVQQLVSASTELALSIMGRMQPGKACHFGSLKHSLTLTP